MPLDTIASAMARTSDHRSFGKQIPAVHPMAESREPLYFTLCSAGGSM